MVQDCQYKVFKDYCKYTIKEWSKVDKVTQKGVDLNPKWPQPNLSSDQRQGSKTETYTIVFSANNKSYDYSFSDVAEFSKYPVGSKWDLEVNGMGQIVSAKPVK